MQRIISLLSSYLLVLFIILCNCAGDSKQKQFPGYGKEAAVQSKIPEYIFAVHPLHNSRRLFEVYQPLVHFINKNTKEFFMKFEASTDYAHFEKKLMDRKLHFALPNPYQSVEALQYGYSIFGKMGDDNRFRGIIVVRKDSNITSINDLRGAVISFPSETALAAAMMPKLFLKTNGLDVEKEAKCVYVGSQESSIMNVLLGQTKAGCTWPPPWESFLGSHPGAENILTVKWQTQPLINNGLVVRNDVPEKHVKVVANILFKLHNSFEGRAILKKINISRFEEISQQEYSSRVNTFIKKYKMMFGSLPGFGEKK